MFTSAVLITGGSGPGFQSAEIYHPNRESSCKFPAYSLPDDFYGHTQDGSDGSLMCGGDYTSRSCWRWNADTGIWDLKTKSLTTGRMGHISWTPAGGSVTYLMGGISDKTSDAVDQDNGVVTSSFPLQYETE